MTHRAPALLAAAAIALALGACSPGEPASDASPASSTMTPDTAYPTATPTPSTATGATASSSTTGPAAVTRTVTVRGRDVSPTPSRVTIDRGQTLRLTVTVDHADELHAHGFEVEEELAANQPATVELTGKDPGLYEVELHHPELRLLQVLVR